MIRAGIKFCILVLERCWRGQVFGGGRQFLDLVISGLDGLQSFHVCRVRKNLSNAVQGVVFNVIVEKFDFARAGLLVGLDPFVDQESSHRTLQLDQGDHVVRFDGNQILFGVRSTLLRVK